MRVRGRPLLLLALLAPFLALFLTILVGLRVNHTPSFPIGFYWTVHKNPERGDLVLFHPPEVPAFALAKARGYIGSGGWYPYEMMLKRIVAVGGDAVSIDAGGV